MIAGIDVGTSNVHVALHGDDGTVAARTARPIVTTYPAADRVEQDPHALVDAALDALAEATEATGDAELVALGLTCQRGTLVAWDRSTGRALAPAIGWQDRRTAPRVAELQAMGIPVSTLLAGLKMEWLRREHPDVRRAADAGTLRFGTVDDWLTWSLSAGRAEGTDPSNAVATGLYDLGTGDWNPMALDLFGIDPAWLAPIVASAETVGSAALSAAGGAEVPLAARIGDQQASFAGFGLGAGDANLTLGTSAMTDLGIGEERRRAPEGTFLLPLWRLPGEEGPVESYCFEGSTMAAGAAVEWLVRVGVLPSVEALDARALQGRPGPVVVPAFAGLGAPHDRPDARALLSGIGFDTTADDVVLATLAGIAQRCAEFADLLEVGDTLHVDGGLSRSRALVQAIADASGRSVLVADETDVSARGAARMAAAAPGIDAEVTTVTTATRPVEPEIDDDERAARSDAFRRAVAAIDG